MELRVLAVARIRLVKEENREGEIERRFGQSWWFRERESFRDEGDKDFKMTE